MNDGISIVDKEKVLRLLKEKKVKILKHTEIGIVKGMEFFKGKIIREQMSSRSNVSLGVVTGFLRNNWYIRTNHEGENLVVVLGTSAPYARVHQTGSKDWDGTFPGNATRRLPKLSNPAVEKLGIRRHNIPKRLHVYEDFKLYGPSYISRSIISEVSAHIKD